MATVCDKCDARDNVVGFELRIAPLDDDAVGCPVIDVCYDLCPDCADAAAASVAKAFPLDVVVQHERSGEG